VLYARLAELSEAGLITREGSGAYTLTAHGRSLERALRPLDAWARRWAGG
jgi:DNA-binding HxlR family transcriptional regulator